MANNTQNSILKTKNLAIGYAIKKNTLVVANPINIELKSGELIGLIGANGVGKSTLIRTLTKVQPALKGQIDIQSKDIMSYTPLELAKVMSLVLTEQMASKNLSVLELVALGRQPYTGWLGTLSKTDLKAIESALKETNTLDLKHKKCFELSDGQLQKVLIARALAQDTNLIILDEPTTHLDMYHKVYLLKLLQKLTKTTHKTILFSSHEIDLAIQLCDKLIIMTKDNVVIDTPCNLISQGAFKNLFPEDLIAFDEITGRFKVKK